MLIRTLVAAINENGKFAIHNRQLVLTGFSWVLIPTLREKPLLYILYKTFNILNLNKLKFINNQA